MLMRALRFLNVALLSVLVGSTALVYSQDEKKEDEKPARQEEPKKDEAKPPRQDEAKPAKPDNRQDNKQMERQDDKRQEQSHDQAMPEKDKQEHPEMRGDRDHQGQERPEARGDHAHPAGKGGRIPDDKFRASFGHEHHFNARTVIVQGQPHFQYGGYSFELIDAWPAEWAYTDDCYIDYIDGEYFLIDLLHPGVRIALTVVM
jgi:cell division protein FtsN